MRQNESSGKQGFYNISRFYFYNWTWMRRILFGANSLARYSKNGPWKSFIIPVSKESGTKISNQKNELM